MAEIYLGTAMSGSEMHLLPKIRWVNGRDPSLPVDAPKSVDQATMLDGSWRFNKRETSPRSWSLDWEMLTTAEMTEMLEIWATNDDLYFQNNWEDATWWTVVMADFQYRPNLRLGNAACRWDVHMALKQAGS